MKNKIVYFMIFLLCIIIVLLLFLEDYNTAPTITKVYYKNEYNIDKTRDVFIKIKRHNKNNIYCKFIDEKNNESDYLLASNNRCTYSIKTGKYKIIIKYNGNKKVSYEKKFDIDDILSIKITNHKKYLALGDSINLNVKLDYVGNVDTNVKYESSNNDILSVDENGNVRANNVGSAVIKVKSSNNLTDEVEIISTNLIRPKTLDNNKQIVSCNSYSQEDIAILDDILDSRVKEAGVGTRAAVAVASRFLTLEFPYKVPYFYENGRLTLNGVTGEGRYYKKGLYLGKEKENEMTKVVAGPSSWGCPLLNYEDDGYRIPRHYYPNGLDCSGYVTWVLVQAGFDLGDIGAGINPYDYDYTDVGELRYNSYDLLHSGSVKVGDLIGWDGHIAIIGAMSDTKIYVTESLLPGVIMDEYDYSSPYSKFYSRYDYIIDMSNVYKEDGNLENMF